MPRLLVTADLHYDHGKSHDLADDLIDRMNAAGGDVLLVVGDTSAADGDAMERCLSRLRFAGPKLFVAGNHELWTLGTDSYALYTDVLPRRVRDLGWHWLEGEPFVGDDWAIVGSVGWYDYSFAPAELGIPRRFYEAKVTPGAARRLEEHRQLFDREDDIPPQAMDVVTRWNDGRFAKLHRPDEEFLAERLSALQAQLDAVAHVPRVTAAVHVLPFRELLPPPRNPQWDFAKAYLGSEKIGELLLRYPNVTRLFCGHSHFPAEAQVGHIHAVNIGSGYRWKTFHAVEL